MKGEMMRFALSRSSKNERRAMSGVTKFALVGASGAVLNTAVLWALYERMHMPLLFASAVAVELAVVSNFLLNDRWTFGRDSRSGSRFAKFNVSSLGGLAVNVLAVRVLDGLGLHFVLANLVGIALGFATNFVLSSNWVWATA